MTEACDYLVDTSAIYRLSRNPDTLDSWREIIGRSLIGYCDATALEVIRASHSLKHYNEIVADLNASLVWVDMPDMTAARARVVQHELVTRGQHHGPSAVDLLVAATAAAHRLIILHYDADFETIAKVTGQPTVWVAPRGSVD